MRYEVMTGVERRRRWSDEEKLSVLGQVGVDGETVTSVARRHDITRQHIYQWRREMRRKGLVSHRDPMLVPVEIAEDSISGHRRSTLGFRTHQHQASAIPDQHLDP